MKIDFSQCFSGRPLRQSEDLNPPARLAWVLGNKAAEKVKKLDSKWKELFKQKNFLSEYSPWYVLDKDLDTCKMRGHSKLLSAPDVLADIQTMVKKEGDNLGFLGVEGTDFAINKQVLRESTQIEQDFKTARDRLFSLLPWIRKTEEIVVDHIVPLSILSHGNKAGFSSVNALGFIFYSFPKRNGRFSFVDFAIDYTHEIGHQVLFRYQLSGEIFKEGFKKTVYSVIKGTTRPAIMAFHAAFALAYMKTTLKYLLSSDGLTDDERDYCLISLTSYNEMLSVTVKELLNKDIEYTTLGKTLMKEILILNQA